MSRTFVASTGNNLERRNVWEKALYQNTLEKYTLSNTFSDLQHFVHEILRGSIQPFETEKVLKDPDQYIFHEPDNGVSFLV